MVAAQAMHLPPFRAAILAFFLGAAFLIGGPKRIGGPSYATLREFGGEIVWGVGFLILALILLAASRFSTRVLFHAYMAAATGYALFALAVLDAARQLETAGLTGIVVYSWVAWIHVLAAATNSRGRLAAVLLRITHRCREILERKIVCSRWWSAAPESSRKSPSSSPPGSGSSQ